MKIIFGSIPIHITSEKGLDGWVRRVAIFCWRSVLLILVGRSEKSPKLGWRYTGTVFYPINNSRIHLLQVNDVEMSLLFNTLSIFRISSKLQIRAGRFYSDLTKETIFMLGHTCWQAQAHKPLIFVVGHLEQSQLSFGINVGHNLCALT